MKRSIPVRLLAAALMLTLSSNCYSASLYTAVRNAFSSCLSHRRLAKDEQVSVIDAPPTTFAHNNNRILQIREQEEFKDAAKHLIQADGNFIGTTQWFDRNREFVVGHGVDYNGARSDWLAQGVIATSRKIALPCALINFIGTAYGLLNVMSVKKNNMSQEDRDSILLNMNIVGLCSLAGMAASNILLHIGFIRPQSKAFMATMRQRILIQHDKKYYYLYPAISAALQDSKSPC